MITLVALVLVSGFLINVFPFDGDSYSKSNGSIVKDRVRGQVWRRGGVMSGTRETEVRDGVETVLTGMNGSLPGALECVLASQPDSST